MVARSRLVCGKFMIDEREGAPGSLTQLPRVVRIRRESSRLLHAFTRTLELLAQEVRSGEAGAEHAPARG